MNEKIRQKPTPGLSGIRGLYASAIKRAWTDANRGDLTAAFWLLSSTVRNACEVIGFDHNKIARQVGAMFLGGEK